MQIFICYARIDKQFAAQLVDDLSAYDVVVWMDVRSIPHGTNWDLEVQKGLDTSDLMLVLLTPASVASQNVADEWSYFIEKNKPIVPLLVEPCEVPFRLSRRQRVDFTPGYEAGFQQLLRAVGSPPLRDPNSPPKILPVPPGKVVQPKASPSAAVSSPGTKTISPPVAPEVGTTTLPVIWAESYNWFNGIGPKPMQGEAMIDRQELKLVPRSRPIVTIPLQSLVSARLQHSVDYYVKLTYYGPDGAFQSLVIMGAPKARRKEIAHQLLNLLKLLTGRSLD